MSTVARNTVKLAARASALRGQLTGRVPLQAPSRSFQSTSVAFKKNRKPLEVEQNYPDEESLENEEEDDLFATSSSSSTPSVRDPSAQLQPLLASVNDVLALPTEERKREFSHVKVGTLRRIVQLYPAEEIEGLKGVLRQWRTLGGRVTRKTAEEIIGRSCHLNKPELAVELITDRTSYGLPALPTHVQSRLHQALLESTESTSSTLPLSPGIPISPTLATLHLALRQKSESPISEDELTRLVGQVKRVKIEAKEADEWRAGARGMLERAGGVWADAAQRIEAVARA